MKYPLEGTTSALGSVITPRFKFANDVSTLTDTYFWLQCAFLRFKNALFDPSL
jgi:hypothetical protein